MALPAIYDVAHKHLFTDRSKMVAAAIPEATIRHIERIRDIYNFWLAFPSKRDRDIVAELKARYGIGDTVAREDLGIIKSLLGDFQRVSKDYIRYRVTQMCERAFELAEKANNTRDMIAAAKELDRAHNLDKEDERVSVIDKLVPVVLRFTDDPAVIGIPRMTDYRSRMKKLKEQYWNEDVEYIDFEPVDLDEVFNTSAVSHGAEESIS